MNKIIESEPKGETLSISCYDSVGVKARMTFDSEDIQGVGREKSVHITYWMDDEEDIAKRVSSIFGILFDEVIKTRKLSRDRELENHIIN